eukprot:1159741-Pelagomonas_calceolata.AAC.4
MANRMVQAAKQGQRQQQNQQQQQQQSQQQEQAGAALQGSLPAAPPPCDTSLQAICRCEQGQKCVGYHACCPQCASLDPCVHLTIRSDRLPAQAIKLASQCVSRCMCPLRSLCVLGCMCSVYAQVSERSKALQLVSNAAHYTHCGVASV